MIKCMKCGEDSVIMVADKSGVEFYSCCNEECSDCAELLVKTPLGHLESVHKMLGAYSQVVKEIMNEKNTIRRS